MEHPLFKPKTFEEGQHSVVGDCNGYSMQERWEKETPLFARQILSYLKPEDRVILDYGCGIGRLAKEVLKQNKTVTVIGIDASSNELKLAQEYVQDSRFSAIKPYELNQKVDLVYCVYVLQHCPAVELREAIQRIHHFLKDDGVFVYCSSDFRMAIRFDGGGFHDDRYLGVNIREEIGRLFEETCDLFTNTELYDNEILNRMVSGFNGNLPHPAKVYRKKSIKNYLQISPEASVPSQTRESKRKLILRNRLSPGDILVMTAAIRSLHKAHPGQFITDVDTPCNDIFQNSPYITPLQGDGQIIDMQYPEIHKSGMSGRHFSDGHRKYLEDVLDVKIPRTGLIPDIFLSQDEKLWPSPVLKEHGYGGKYWVINAGSKGDYPLKQYHRYQEVIDLLKDKYQFVQIGIPEHNHPPLTGVLDMRGKTGHRELFRLIHHAEGVVTCVSYPMHVAAAFLKPCVVIAGGREGTRWELYPNHRFLHTNGAMDCCSYDGCWKSKIEECAHAVHPEGDGLTKPAFVDEFRAPLCMELITPQMIADAVEMYYKGGILKREEVYA